MQETLHAAVADALHRLDAEEVFFVVEHPTELTHGDYATNAAMIAAKKLGKNPQELAAEIINMLKKPDGVEKIEIAGPGFINFYLSRDFLADQIKEMRKQKQKWGASTLYTEEKIAVEYTSPNLFKPLHVGNLVGNIIGESLCRLFEYNGADVKRFNYPSDIGLTVAKGVWGLMQTGGDPDDINAIGAAYRTGNEAYEADGAEKEAIDEINKKLYEGTDDELNTLREKGIATSKARLSELLAQLGTTFDGEITESEAGEPGAAIVRQHIGGVFEESDGAVVFKGEKVGLHTRVFLNSKGLPTYEAKEIGHFKLKDEAYPEWTRSVIVTGGEQREYFKVIFAALHELFPEAKNKIIEHIPTGFLTLTTGKMSSRKGNVLTGESLIEEVREESMKRAAESRAKNPEKLSSDIAIAALKYQILRQKVGSDIVFDKQQALSFEGDSGPYLQYTHARIGSVLEKADAASVKPDAAHIPQKPYKVEQLLYRFPEVVEKATIEREPHHLVTYLTELAGTFNTFYAEEKIADADDEYAPYKAAVAEAVQLTLGNGLWLLGINAPERM